MFKGDRKQFQYTIQMLKIFWEPFCAPPTGPSVLVHRSLLHQENGAPLHFAPARQPNLHVLGGILSAHPSEPQTF